MPNSLEIISQFIEYYLSHRSAIPVQEFETRTAPNNLHDSRSILNRRKLI